MGATTMFILVLLDVHRGHIRARRRGGKTCTFDPQLTSVDLQRPLAHHCWGSPERTAALTALRPNPAQQHPVRRLTSVLVPAQSPPTTAANRSWVGLSLHAPTFDLAGILRGIGIREAGASTPPIGSTHPHPRAPSVLNITEIEGNPTFDHTMRSAISNETRFAQQNASQQIRLRWSRSEPSRWPSRVAASSNTPAELVSPNHTRAVSSRPPSPPL